MIYQLDWSVAEKDATQPSMKEHSAIDAAAAIPSAAAIPTPLASALTMNQPLPLTEYRGVLTVENFSQTSAELDALFHGVGVYDLGWKSLLRCSGEDRIRWLNGMVTNSIVDLKEDAGCYAFVLNAQGRIQGDVDVYRHADSLWLSINRVQIETLRAFLDHYIIMDDVTLEPDDQRTFIGTAGPRAASTLAAIGFDTSALVPMQMTETSWQGSAIHAIADYSPLTPRYELWIERNRVLEIWGALTAAGAQPCGVSAIEQLRTLEGRLAYGIDIGSRDLPQETNQMRALHFSKGCYLGQEIVERIRSRGGVHRTFTGFELASEAPEKSPLLADGQPAGELTSVTRVTVPGLGERVIALARVRLEPLERKASFTVREVSATPCPLPFDFARRAVQP